jgi:RND family efflux transporter MFP subunit
VRANSLIATLFTVTICSAAPPEVAVVKPIEKEITDYADLTGRTEPSTSVEIRARVTGYLDKVLFKEGSQVKRGDLLFQLEDRVQKAALGKAEAEVKVAEAKLKIAEASLQRLMELLKRAAISKEEFEMAQATMDAAKAEVNAARASLEVAKINLVYTRIASPINGHIGRSNVDAGNLVKADGDPSLATVIVTDPLFVSFDIDERTVLRLMRMNRDAKEAKTAISLGFADEKDYPHKATLDFMDNKLNAETGSIRCRAVLENPKSELLPGMFAKVRIALGQPRKALLLPESALFTSDGVGVLVVTDKNVLESRKVEVGGRFDELYEVKQGLKATDVVVRDPRGRKVGDEVKPREGEKLSPAKPGPGGVSAPRPLPELPVNGPALIVTATYLGANAHVVDETVAGPISQQINGMEGLVHQFASCTNDGEMRLTLLLKKGTDLNTAQVVAQNRVALALPALPEVVNRQGISVKKRTVQLLSLALLATDDSRDHFYLARFADKQIKDEVSRVAGVGDVSFFGDVNPQVQMRLEFDRTRLAALGVTVNDVVTTLHNQNLSTGTATNESLIVSSIGRVVDAETLTDLIVKANKEGRMIRLRDVAKVEMTSGVSSMTTLDGKACVVLLISRTFDADAKETEKAVRERIEALKKVLPTGLDFRVIESDK